MLAKLTFYFTHGVHVIKSNPYFACFKKKGDALFRLDTRIYLRSYDKPAADDICIAAVVGKNPGSAKPEKLRELASLNLDGDKLLPYVRNRFLEAYKSVQQAIPEGAFVRVWNLFYLCEVDPRIALKKYQAIEKPLKSMNEHTSPPIVWYVWGSPQQDLDGFKDRFLNRDVESCFYYENESKQVIAEKPTKHSKARHTQGMPPEPIVRHLAKLLK